MDPAPAPTAETAAAPTVKATPVFKPGETIRHKDEGTEFKILSITPEGHLQCQGRAGLLPPSCAEKL